MPHAKPRLYRDPVHDTIAFAPDTAEGRLMMALLDAREVQRLRRIRQLALSSLVYHGAEHSRFSHSIGVAWLARRMLDSIARGVDVPEDERLVTLAAALLHDVGHGPFSHALETLGGGHHEERTLALILDPASEIHAVLASTAPDFPARVAARVGGTDTSAPWLREIVSSQLDADRLDYILRDGHMTGVQIGRYDLERILAMLDVADDGHLAFHTGGQAAVEGYLLARFHMYQQVYLHKTSRSAERMLVAALARASELCRDGARPEPWPAGPLGELLAGHEIPPARFAELDDVDVWAALKSFAHADDPVLAHLASGLLHRRLWKARVLPAQDDARADELVAAARSIARVKGYDPEHHILVDESWDSPYRPYTGVEGSRKAIRLIDREGRKSFLEDRSSLVQMLGGVRHRQRLLCYHPALRGALARLFEPRPEGRTR